MENEQNLKFLLEAVEGLSTDPLVLFRRLENGSTPNAGDIDDLCEDLFDYLKVFSPEDIGEELHANLQEVDDMISKISGQENMQFWTKDALLNSVEWKEIRLKSSKCVPRLKTLISEKHGTRDV